MTQPIFDGERLDVDRLAIVDSAVDDALNLCGDSDLRTRKPICRPGQILDDVRGLCRRFAALP